MKKRFDGFCILTRDVIKLSNFYQDVLEAEVDGDDIHCFVHLDSFSFALFNPAKAEGSQVFMTNSGSGSIITEFEVDDVDAEYKRLKDEAGVTILIPPRTNPWGRRAMHFLDPDGNVVNFYKTVNRE
jgi:predicted enzyme related to lactoylglutathione lyase